VRETRGEAARRLTAVRVGARPDTAPAPETGHVGQGGEGLLPAPEPRRTVRPLAAVAGAGVAVVVAVLAWVNARGSGEAVELAPRGTSSIAARASTTPSPVASLSAVSPSPSPAGVVVDVEGRVHRPGLQRLPPGSRVADAVRAAGGTTPGAVLTALNLARLLTDGEQVVVPAPGDPAPAAGGAGPPADGSTTSGGPAAGPLDLNTATPPGLDSLPGIGPVLAERIVAWRTQHGRFTSVDELAEVPGIGPKALERLRPLVRV
jgi:competence protein ComEA